MMFCYYLIGASSHLYSTVEYQNYLKSRSIELEGTIFPFMYKDAQGKITDYMQGIKGKIESVPETVNICGNKCTTYIYLLVRYFI